MIPVTIRILYVELKKLYLSARIYEWILEPPLRRIKKKIADYINIKELSPTLDLCCGTGAQTRWIAQNKNVVFGLDLDQNILHYAAQKYPTISFLCSDAGEIPLKDERFKSIIISYALHDKSERVRRNIISEAKRLLLPVP